MDNDYKIYLAYEAGPAEITLHTAPLPVEVEGSRTLADISILSINVFDGPTRSHWRLEENWTAHMAYEALTRAAGTDEFLPVLNAVRRPLTQVR